MKADGRLDVRLECLLESVGTVTVRDEAGRVAAQTGGPIKSGELTFEAANGGVYTVTW